MSRIANPALEKAQKVRVKSRDRTAARAARTQASKTEKDCRTCDPRDSPSEALVLARTSRCSPRTATMPTTTPDAEADVPLLKDTRHPFIGAQDYRTHARTSALHFDAIDQFNGQRSVPGNRIGSLRGYCHAECSGRNSASQQNKPSSWGRAAVSFLLALRGLKVKKDRDYQGQEPRTASRTNRSGIELFHLSGGST
jgi:hypothetical protein